MDGLAWVVLGSGLGGMARYAVSGIVARRVGETFPWGTMVVNVTGAFAVGTLAAAAVFGSVFEAGSDAWLLAVIGFLGSYTTVSSLSWQTLALARDGEWSRVVLNVLASLALGFGAVAVGMLAGGAVLQAWS